MPVTQTFDPFDVEQGRRHHEAMAELRATCPVARLGSGMFVVSRYDDVRSMLTDPHMSNTDAARAPGVTVPGPDRLFFFEYDPPLHVPLRRLLRDLLSRQRAEATTPEVRALVTELLTPLLNAGGGEVVEEFTAPLVGRLMMRLAGFPEQDAPRWRGWIRDMIRSGFSFTNANERGTGFEQCYPDLLGYLDRHIEGRAARRSCWAWLRQIATSRFTGTRARSGWTGRASRRTSRSAGAATPVPARPWSATWARSCRTSCSTWCRRSGSSRGQRRSRTCRRKETGSTSCGSA